MNVQELLQKLEHAKKSGSGWTARCPGHEDKENSLSVTDKDGKILLHCFAGCPVEQIVQALGIETKELFQSSGLRVQGSKPKTKNQEPRTVVAEYVYTDEHGHALAKKIRYEPKFFSWSRFESGEWKNGLGKVKPGLYRWAEVKNEPWILIVEGEKDADAGAQIGLPTTTSGGVNTWTEAHSALLAGKSVVILADADGPGRAHARAVAKALWDARQGATTGKSACATIKILELPGSKDLSEALEKGLPKEALLALIAETAEWRPRPGSDVLDEVYDFVRKYVSLSHSAAVAITLWLAHTYAAEVFEYTPYLAILSPEKQSGKTRLLDVLNMLAARAEMMARTTAAALVRTIASEKPTILLDEIDAIFDVRDDSEFAQSLRGILNSGYQINGFTRVCVGQGANIQVVKLATYCPKALAGIGNLPDTIKSRSLHVEMTRARPHTVARMRISRVRPHAQKLAGDLDAWVQTIKKLARESDPQMPDSLSDRQMDFCEPLMAIADLASGAWPQQAREALVNLCINESKNDDSTGVELLRDIKSIFDPAPEGELGLTAEKLDRIASKRLSELLGAMEDRPWAAWSKGLAISPAQIARVLHRYKVGPKSLRMEGSVMKGYERAQFVELWDTYLPQLSSVDFTAE